MSDDLREEASGLEEGWRRGINLPGNPASLSLEHPASELWPVKYFTMQLTHIHEGRRGVPYLNFVERMKRTNNRDCIVDKAKTTEKNDGKLAIFGHGQIRKEAEEARG